MDCFVRLFRSCKDPAYPFAMCNQIRRGFQQILFCHRKRRVITAYVLINERRLRMQKERLLSLAVFVKKQSMLEDEWRV